MNFSDFSRLIPPPTPRPAKHRNSPHGHSRIPAARVYRNGKPFVKDATGKWVPMWLETPKQQEAAS